MRAQVTQACRTLAGYNCKSDELICWVRVTCVWLEEESRCVTHTVVDSAVTIAKVGHACD